MIHIILCTKNTTKRSVVGLADQSLPWRLGSLQEGVGLGFVERRCSFRWDYAGHFVRVLVIVALVWRFETF